MIYHARPASSPFYPACCGRGSGAAPWRRAGRWRWTPTRRRCRCRRRWGWAARWAAASSSRERGGSRCTLKGSMAWSIWLDRILWAIYPTWHAELAGHDKVKNLAKCKSSPQFEALQNLYFEAHDIVTALTSYFTQLCQTNRTKTDRRRRETIRFICIENAVQHCIKFFARRAADVGTVMYLVWAVLAHARSTASLSSGNFILMKTSYILQCW